jgi:hypothetical protein
VLLLRLTDPAAFAAASASASACALANFASASVSYGVLCLCLCQCGPSSLELSGFLATLCQCGPSSLELSSLKLLPLSSVELPVRLNLHPKPQSQHPIPLCPLCQHHVGGGTAWQTKRGWEPEQAHTPISSAFRPKQSCPNFLNMLLLKLDRICHNLVRAMSKMQLHVIHE